MLGTWQAVYLWEHRFDQKERVLNVHIIGEKRQNIYNVINKTYINFFMEPYLLQNEELQELAVKIPGWEISNEQIKREFKFSNFIEAFSFMTKIALICEKYNHHPNWENVYSRVIIRLSTHDLGGITNLEQTLASEINKVFDQ